MTSLAPLVFLLAPGVILTIGLIMLGLWQLRQDSLRERRDRAVARELNSRRWIFAQQIGAIGRVPSGERRSA